MIDLTGVLTIDPISERFNAPFGEVNIVQSKTLNSLIDDDLIFEELINNPIFLKETQEDLALLSGHPDKFVNLTDKYKEILDDQMYEIVANKSRRIEKNFYSLIDSLPETEQKQVFRTLRNFPKGNPKDENNLYCHVEKKKLFRQLYINSTGERIIYVVIDKEKKVLVRFAGSHDDAQIFLRNNKS